jgi:hypothetical protein
VPLGKDTLNIEKFQGEGCIVPSKTKSYKKTFEILNLVLENPSPMAEEAEKQIFPLENEKVSAEASRSGSPLGISSPPSYAKMT